MNKTTETKATSKKIATDIFDIKDDVFVAIDAKNNESSTNPEYPYRKEFTEDQKTQAKEIYGNLTKAATKEDRATILQDAKDLTILYGVTEIFRKKILLTPIGTDKTKLQDL